MSGGRRKVRGFATKEAAVKTRKPMIIAILTGALLLMASSAFAQGRKLPVGAYIKSARIEIISGDVERYKNAIALLDSLFMHYGPHAEGLSLMSKIMVDYLDRTPNLEERRDYVAKMVAYIDSLHMCCENDAVDKKYKKDCKQFIESADSTKVKYWREFYNSAIGQLQVVSDANNQLAADPETDKDRLNARIEANVDSCTINFEMAIMIDGSDFRPYVGLGTMYERLEDFPAAIEWLKKGLDKTADSTSLLQSLAYNYINGGNYCDAATYLQMYVDRSPEDIVNMSNLAICFSNCGNYPKAREIYTQVLELEPGNTDALVYLGRFWSQEARQAQDSVNLLRTEANPGGGKEMESRRDAAYDSALVYFGRAAEANPSDELALEQHGIISAIRGKHEQAEKTFAKLVELKPSEPDYWTFLGDTRLKLQKFEGAVAAYEKVVESKPNDIETWERLSDLYNELGQKDKSQKAKAKVTELKG